MIPGKKEEKLKLYIVQYAILESVVDFDIHIEPFPVPIDCAVMETGIGTLKSTSSSPSSERWNLAC